MILYSNFKGGLTTDAPLLVGALTINSPGFANLPVVAAPDLMWLVLDPESVNGTPEIVLVTAHTASATSVTVTRGQQTGLGSFAARQHPVSTEWVCASTAQDLATHLTTILTTKGDLATLTAANSAARLGVGSNNQVLVADSAQATGLKWGQAATAGIADNAVTTAKIVDLAVTTAKIADANVTAAKLAANVQPQVIKLQNVAHSATGGVTTTVTFNTETIDDFGTISVPLSSVPITAGLWALSASASPGLNTGSFLRISTASTAYDVPFSLSGSRVPNTVVDRMGAQNISVAVHNAGSTTSVSVVLTATRFGV